MHIIPIGIDCGIAQLLKNYRLRTVAYPFDWNVSYGGVGKIFESFFQGYIPTATNWNETYGTWFMHDTFPEDGEKYVRRIDRMLELLKTTTEEVRFIRKGHAVHNHEEEHGSSLCNEIEDAVHLDNVLQHHFPHLTYKIVVIIICGNCYSQEHEYSTNSPRITIYNIASQLLYDEENITRIVLKEISE